jgi:hypothetical protein
MFLITRVTQFTVFLISEICYFCHFAVLTIFALFGLFWGFMGGDAFGVKKGVFSLNKAFRWEKCKKIDFFPFLVTLF